MDKEKDRFIDEGVDIEEIADEYIGTGCVQEYGMETPPTCNVDADCYECWIKCLKIELEGK